VKADQNYCVALFDSVSQVMKAEKILKNAGIPHKLIPVPRSISTDCGVCLRFLPEQKEMIIKTLEPTIHVSEVYDLLS
jgi:hypothetical protein